MNVDCKIYVRNHESRNDVIYMDIMYYEWCVKNERVLNASNV